jgi:hypothetical protein
MSKEYADQKYILQETKVIDAVSPAFSNQLSLKNGSILTLSALPPWRCSGLAQLTCVREMLSLIGAVVRLEQPSS